jgi:two-component system, NarL family, nitrate/nitrite response regulator NarL
VASRRISSVIADRHPVVLFGLSSILSGESDFHVVASCRDSKTFIEIIRDRSPDLALLDPSLLGDLSGRELLSAIKSEHLGTRVVFFSSETREVATAIARGAHGVIPREASPELLLRSLRKVASGQRLLPRAGRKSRARPLQKSHSALTEREREIAHLVREGLSDKEVARELNLSGSTVRLHLHRIYRKLAIQNRTALATLARRDLTSSARAKRKR